MVYMTGLLGIKKLSGFLLSKGGFYAILVLLAISLSFWTGYKFASASYEKELREYEERIGAIAEAISKSQNEAVERHNKELENERKRFLRSQEKSAAILSQTKRLVDEARLSNNTWSDSQRMRLKELYHIYGYDEAGKSNSNGMLN